jgi:hypothetical protein
VADPRPVLAAFIVTALTSAGVAFTIALSVMIAMYGF